MFFASSVYLILSVSPFFSLSGFVSDELPLNFAAEVHCLKGTTPKTTEKEETTVAAVQTQPSERICFSHPLSLSFLFKKGASLTGRMAVRVQNQSLAPRECSAANRGAGAARSVENK